MSDEQQPPPPPKKNAPHLFQPGVSGNPAGRPPLAPEVKQLRRLNRAAFEMLLDKIMYLPYSELKEMTDKEKRQNATVVELALARVVEKCIVTGDHKGLIAFLEQMIGKATVRLEATGLNGSPLFGASRNSHERMAKIRDVQEALEKLKKAEVHGFVEPAVPRADTSNESES